MQLELTLQEAAQLEQTLTAALALHVDDAEQQALETLLEKVVEAEAHSTRQHRCPVCQQLFTQETVGRIGLYCTAACKQKAYRQRRNAWRRRIPSNRSK